MHFSSRFFCASTSIGDADRIVADVDNGTFSLRGVIVAVTLHGGGTMKPTRIIPSLL